MVLRRTAAWLDALPAALAAGQLPSRTFQAMLPSSRTGVVLFSKAQDILPPLLLLMCQQMVVLTPQALLGLASIVPHVILSSYRRVLMGIMTVHMMPGMNSILNFLIRSRLKSSRNDTLFSTADFSGIDISEGNQIVMSVVATSLTSGSATIQNLSTGQKVTQTFSRVTAGSLCETGAEFIIEDLEECNSNENNCQPVLFASFSPAVKFKSALATHKDQSVSLSGAVVTEVIVNNQNFTRCSVSGSTLTCSYV